MPDKLRKPKQKPAGEPDKSVQPMRPVFDVEITPPITWRPGRTTAGSLRSHLGDQPMVMGDGPIVMGDSPFPMGDGPIVNGDGPSWMGSVSTPRLRVGLGYHSDVPDSRDFDLAIVEKKLRSKYREAIEKSYLFTKKRLLQKYDVRNTRKAPWPVENQGPLQSCTAHAVVGMLEFLVERGCNEQLDLSRLFLYKATRRLLMWSGDSGAFIRTTMKAAGTFGVPPENYWPYDLSRFDVDPDAFLYSFALRYTALLYARLDAYGLTGEQTLESIKRAICDGFPVAFGFPVYSSLNTTRPDVPLPDSHRDTLKGGHAVLAVGFDDSRPVAGDNTGALVFRNSWGPLWGEAGYGYLPYAYVRNQWAVDFWTVFREAWLSPSAFSDPRGDAP